MTGKNMADLAAYAALSNRLRQMGQDDELTIRPGDFGDGPADHTDFDGMVINTAYQRLICWPGEGDFPFELIDRSAGFEGFALPESYRRFGLWMLHVLLSGRDWAGLNLTHPASHAQHFYLHIAHPTAPYSGLQRDARPGFSGYVYCPTEVWRHPFADHGMTPVQRVEEHDRPLFAFGWRDTQAAYRWDIAKADQIILQATPDGIAAMAALMIDMGHPTLGRDEINLEPPIIGFAATQPRSLEARFWLPGSIAFPGDDLDSLFLPPRP